MSGLKDAIGNKVEVGSRVLLDTSFKSSIGYVTEITEPSNVSLVSGKVGPVQKKPGTVKIICEYRLAWSREGELQGLFALRNPPTDPMSSYQGHTSSLALAKKEAGVVELPPASGNEQT